MRKISVAIEVYDPGKRCFVCSMHMREKSLATFLIVNGSYFLPTPLIFRKFFYSDQYEFWKEFNRSPPPLQE